MTKTPTTALGGLNYNTCKRHELDRFYQQRLHKKVPTGINKTQLIQMLRSKDQQPGEFRFLDLPAELRNAVYKELLVLPRPGPRRRIGVCQPAVLQTCRQVYSEARSILYGENEPEVIIGVVDYSSPNQTARQLRRKCSIPLFSKLVPGDRVGWDAFSLICDVTKSLWLRHLPRFHNISVRIDIGNERGAGLGTGYDSELLAAVNQLLYCLCVQLASLPQKRLFTLKLNAETDLVSSKDLYNAFWPITRLGVATTIHSTGVPKKVQQLLSANRTTSSSSPNLLKKVLRSQSKADMITGEIRSLSKEDQEMAYEDIETWRMAHRSIWTLPKWNKSMDRFTDRELRASMAILESFPTSLLSDLINANMDREIRMVEKTRAKIMSGRLLSC